jgi:carbonic anhydrase
MKKLLHGILNFRNNISDERREHFARLAQGQSPDALLIACSDSRVAPNVFASTDPGDVFVTRNVGNIVPPYVEGPAFHAAVMAGVEFAVSVLKVSDVVVCGHSGCGAMIALHGGLDQVASPGIRAWLTHASPAAERLMDAALESIPLERRHDGALVSQLGRHWWNFRGNQGLTPVDRLSQISVLVQLEHLLTIPLLREAVEANRIRLHGWWFDIGNAELSAWDLEANQFAPLDEPHVRRVLARIGKL